MAPELHHVVEGPEGAPAVVLSPSLGTELWMWDALAERLRDRFRIVRYDLPGHGRSPAQPGAYTIPGLGEDLLALLDRLGLDRVALAGVSIGGMISMSLAARAPERVQRLALVCTSAMIDRDGAYRARAELVRAQGMHPVADAVLERWLTPGFGERQPAVVRRMRESLLAIAPEGYAGCCDALAAMDLRDELPSISAPTLVIAGALDAATPPEHGRLIAEGVREGWFEVLPDVMHLANVEQPERVGALIEGFLQEEH